VKTYTVILSPDPNAGGYAVIVPAMPGALTEADTRAEALERISAVMAIWLEIAAADGYAPRDETPELIADEVASVLEDRSEEGWDWTVELATVSPSARVAA
jgi:predicted RNase H-like HicB family nuclease